MTDLRNLNREDELLVMLEEMQDQIETLTKKLETESYKNLESSKVISELSSVNSEMKKELLKKSETIKSLNETIGKLSESDLILKENEELKKQNLILEISALSARKEADDKLKALETREQNVVSQEKELAGRQKHQRTEVNKKVEKKLAERERELLFSYNRYESDLETKYRVLETKYMAGFIITLVYAIVVTLIHLFKSEVFKTDLIDFGKGIVNTGAWGMRRFTDLIDIIYGMRLIRNVVGNKVINTTLIVMLGIILSILVIYLWKNIKKYIRLTMEMADKSMLGTLLLIFTGNMMFGNWIKQMLSINLIVSMIFECGIAWVIRMKKIKKERMNKQKSYSILKVE